MTLAQLALAFVAAIWPAHWAPPSDAADIAAAAARAVAADAEPPATGSRELDLAVLLEDAYDESSFRAHAEGDCREVATGRPVPGGASPKDVHAGVWCASHGAWQQASGYGRLDLDSQAQAILRELHRSVAACPAHPLAWMVSGAGKCQRGTRLSDYRMARARRWLRTNPP